MTSTFLDRTDVLCLVGEMIRKLRHRDTADEYHLDKQHFLLLNGAPGLGKTELLRCLEQHYSKPHDDCIPMVSTGSEVLVQTRPNSLVADPQASESATIHAGSIIIVTVTRTETRAVLRVFSSDPEVARHVIGSKTYYDLGLHGGEAVYLVQSEMGTATPGGALLTVKQAIQDLAPQAIIMCGIAFGLRPDKQKLGDVLVARQLQYYEPQKVDTQSGQMPRGDRVTASDRLLDRCRGVDIEWTEVPTHFGLVLSGESVVNEPAFRDWLLGIEPEAIGGEMEGAGLYAAARSAGVDWILVKGICDWADGKKNDDAQPLAADNAAKFVFKVIQHGGWRKTEPNRNTTPSRTTDPTLGATDALMKPLESSRPSVLTLEQSLPMAADSAGHPRVTACGQKHDPLPCVFVDLFKYSAHKPKQGREFVHLLQDILSDLRGFASGELAIKTDDILRSVAKHLDEFGRLRPEDHEKDIIDLTDQFQDLVEDFIDRFGVVLVLVDNVDSSTPDILDQFSAHILDRLRNRRAFVVVLAARRMMKWNPSTIVQYSRRHQLTVFPVEHTKQQIGVMDDIAANGLHRLTGGNPFANTLLAPKLRDVNSSPDIMSKWLTDNGQELSRDLKTRVVDQYMLKDLPSALAHDVRDAFLKISLTRLFEVNLFYEVLISNYPPRPITGTDANWYFRLMSMMQDSGLLTFDESKRAFIMEPSARRILAEFYRRHHTQEYIDLIEQVILRKYEEWIRNRQDDMHVFVAERLYLRACLIAHGDPDLTPAEISGVLKVGIRQTVPSGTNRERLRAYLTSERSSEFGEVVDLDKLIKAI